MTKNDELICITLGLDILLITIVLTQSLNIFDRTILYIVFIIHAIFIYVLAYNNRIWIDIMHIAFFVYIYLFAFLITNRFLIMVFIWLFIVMTVYWVVDQKCPFGRFETIPVIHNLLNSYPNYIIWLIPVVPFGILVYKLINDSYKDVDFFPRPKVQVKLPLNRQ